MAKIPARPARRSAWLRRRWRWLLVAVVLLFALIIGWAWQQSREAELTSLAWDRAWGVRVEADFAPVLPITVTGATLTTDAGGGVGYLWDTSSAAEMPPDQMRIHWGRPASLSFTFVPTCEGPVDDEGVITLQTANGERRVSVDLPRLSDAVKGWCAFVETR